MESLSNCIDFLTVMKSPTSHHYQYSRPNLQNLTSIDIQDYLNLDLSVVY